MVLGHPALSVFWQRQHGSGFLPRLLPRPPSRPCAPSTRSGAWLEWFLPHLVGTHWRRRVNCQPSLMAATYFVVTLAATICKVRLPANFGCHLENRPNRSQTVTATNRLTPNATTHPSRGRTFRGQAPERGTAAQAREGGHGSGRARRQNATYRPPIHKPTPRQPQNVLPPSKRLSLNQNRPISAKGHRLDARPSQNRCRSGGF